MKLRPVLEVIGLAALLLLLLACLVWGQQRQEDRWLEEHPECAQAPTPARCADCKAHPHGNVDCAKL